MDLYEKILNKHEKIAVVGLGYVGLPLAVAFAEKIDVIGFDINSKKIDEYKKGHDITVEVGDEKLEITSVKFTCDEIELKKAKFYIVAVPTPINEDKSPNLNPLIGASQVVGRNLTKGSIVVFESTVYPGVTEEICLPILEKESGLKCGIDFKIGYSPERINPGDKVHTVEKIIKVVSGMDKEALDDIARLYELVITAGVHRAESIMIAEAAKVIENSQRDINIAFMNELSIIFNKMNIDTKAVLEASGTKWNFLKFSPGLVGGHCIGVDPYYLTYKAQLLGYHSQVILAGRRINDGMGKYVAESTVKNLIKADKQIKGAKVAVMGITFKENCPDVRNSKVIDIIRELEEYGIDVKVCDPIADKVDVLHLYKIQLSELKDITEMDALIFAVAHEEFTKLNLEDIKKFYLNAVGALTEAKKFFINDVDTLGEVAATLVADIPNQYVLTDVKGIYDRKDAAKNGYLYWRL